MTDPLILSLEPEIQPLAHALLIRAKALYPEARITSTRRTCAEQNALFARGPTVTKAKGCQSWHVWGLAFDLTLGTSAKIQDYAVLGTYWRSLGGKWGGDFEDYGHFEYHPGKTIESVCPDPDRCVDTPIPFFYGFNGLAAKSPEFICELWNVGKRLGIDPNWIAGVIACESGFNHRARNHYCMSKQSCAPACCAVGLIQFMPVAASALGTTTTALYNMSDVQQLAYVEKFYQRQRSKLRSAGDVYMATFLPLFVGSSVMTVLGKKGSSELAYPGTSLDTVYVANSGLDREGKGYITVGDVHQVVNNAIEAASARAPVPVDCTSPKASQGGSSLEYSDLVSLPMLCTGCCGPAVKLWQTLLHHVAVKADSKFGPVTEKYTREWQKKRNLPATGIVDLATWDAVL